MAQNERDAIIQRVRALREAVGESTDGVAQATAIDHELYEAYEAGKCDIPLSYLSTLAAYFKVEVNALLSGRDAHARVFCVTRAGCGPVVARSRQYHYEALATGFAARAMEAYRVTVEPGTDGITLNTHTGQEFNLVESGTLLVRVDGHDTRLEPGDSIYFDASRPHGMMAIGGKPAAFLAIITAQP